MGLLDLIFPKYCVNCKKFGDYLCSDCFSRLSFDTKNICLVCGRPSYDGLTHPKCIGKYSIDGSFTAVVFNGISKKMIYKFKYGPYLSGLTNFLVELLYESLVQNEEWNKITSGNFVFVPVPLSNAKFRKRGYNQAELLAKGLSRKFGFEVLNCLERAENLKGVFVLNKKFENLVNNKNIVLVDNVLTTNLIFSEAANFLKRNGAKKVWALAFVREDLANKKP